MQKTKTSVTQITAPARKSSPWPRLALYAVPIILLALVAVPNFVRARSTPCKNACVNNLRQIEGAKEQFALESKSPPGTAVTLDQIRDYLKGGVLPRCPADGKITIGAVGQLPTCSSREGHRIEIPRN